MIAPGGAAAFWSNSQATGPSVLSVNFRRWACLQSKAKPGLRLRSHAAEASYHAVAIDNNQNFTPTRSPSSLSTTSTLSLMGAAPAPDLLNWPSRRSIPPRRQVAATLLGLQPPKLTSTRVGSGNDLLHPLPPIALQHRSQSSKLDLIPSIALDNQEHWTENFTVNQTVLTSSLVHVKLTEFLGQLGPIRRARSKEDWSCNKPAWRHHPR